MYLFASLSQVRLFLCQLLFTKTNYHSHPGADYIQGGATLWVVRNVTYRLVVSFNDAVQFSRSKLAVTLYRDGEAMLSFYFSIHLFGVTRRPHVLCVFTRYASYSIDCFPAACYIPDVGFSLLNIAIIMSAVRVLIPLSHIDTK
jgi:hypothetical protein